MLILSTFAFADGKLLLSSRNISTHDGLPGNTINELVQDEDGYIWTAEALSLLSYERVVLLSVVLYVWVLLPTINLNA